MTKPTRYLSTFHNNDILVLTPASNGGWVVKTQGGAMDEHTIIGAFSDTKDMLDALALALSKEPEDE